MTPNPTPPADALDPETATLAVLEIASTATRDADGNLDEESRAAIEMIQRRLSGEATEEEIAAQPSAEQVALSADRLPSEPDHAADADRIARRAARAAVVISAETRRKVRAALSKKNSPSPKPSEPSA